MKNILCRFFILIHPSPGKRQMSSTNRYKTDNALTTRCLQSFILLIIVIELPNNEKQKYGIK